MLIMHLVYRTKKFVKELVFYVFEGLAPLFNTPRTIEREKVKKILVAEGGGIGDLIRVFPAIECLKDNFPKAYFALLASPGASEIVSHFFREDVFSEIIPYDLKEKHRGFLRKIPLILYLRKKRYDLLYSPDRGEGMREEILIGFLTGAPHRLGFQKGRTGALHTVKIAFKQDIPILWQNLDILKAARLHITKKEIDIRIREDVLREAKQCIGDRIYDSSAPLIIIHPGASWKARYRCWPLEKYIALMKRLRDELNAAIVIIGSKDEQDMEEKISAAMKPDTVISMIGKTTIPQMAALMKLSTVFIGNDSGPLHIALALKVPSVAIFGSTSPEQILTPDVPCVVIKKKDVSCSPCYVHQYDYEPSCAYFTCLEEITVDEVFQGVKKALQSE